MYILLKYYLLRPRIKETATLLTNARRQFSSDGCLSKCMTRASARRVSCSNPHRHPRSTHAVHCNANSQVLSFFATFLSFSSPPAMPPKKGFFASFDAWLPKVRGYQLDVLHEAVMKGWGEYPPEMLQKLDSTWHLVMRRMHDAGGDNSFDLPHHRDYGIKYEKPDEFERMECQ